MSDESGRFEIYVHSFPGPGQNTWVKYLRPLSQRNTAHDDIDRYERVFIGLYRRESTSMEFFDVALAPPKQGRPRNLLSYSEFLDEIEKTFLKRNVAEFEWADDPGIETNEPPPDDEA
ncbi:MAG TPA: hypothetical protein VMW48_19395 [Vicinamibacterales bacterium]|nr:hypothetical protein [Vicinamibacterales bacterium]